MNDQELIHALRRLDAPAIPDQRFQDALRVRLVRMIVRPSMTSTRGRRWSRYAAVAAAIAVVAITVSVAVRPDRGQGQGQPTAVPSASASLPSPSASDIDAGLAFDRPFRFRIPADVHLEVNEAFLPMLLELIDGPVADEGQYGSSGNGMPAEVRGIEIASLRGAVTTHPCPIPSNRASRFPVRDRQPAFLADLSSVGGMTFSPPTTTTVASRPAISTHLTAAACGSNDFHVSTGGYVGLAVPSRLTLVDFDGPALAIQVWASTEDELAAWLPTAQTIIDSIEFVEP